MERLEDQHFIQEAGDKPGERERPSSLVGHSLPAEDSFSSDFGDSLLEQLAASSLSSGPLPLHIPPGTRLGGEDGQRFEIIDGLGVGAMGQVFRARDLLLERITALKLIFHRKLHSQQALESLFLAEARATAKLNHENIVRIFDLGTWNGIPYLVIEYLEGTSLFSLLKQERLSPRRAIQLMLQITAGLAHAHQQGLIHRDLKPSNVFVLKDGTVKLLDFGLAHLTAMETPHLPEAGTPLYMAPEQWLGLHQDERTDIWAAGIILFEMLTGAPPYRETRDSWSRSVVNPRAPMPSARERNPEVSEELDQLLRRALQKDPDLRFQSADEFREALLSVEAQLPHPPPAVSEPAHRTALATQRRQVTLLSCRLGRQVSASMFPSPDDLGEVLEVVHQSCAEQIKKFDGTILSSVNDQLLVCFGCCQTREDDAERAMHVAESILSVLEERLRHFHQPGLLPRIGIHTGVVQLEHFPAQAPSGLSSILGGVPTIAGAIAERAEPGVVLISEQTHRLVWGSFATERLGACSIEGSAQEVVLHRLLHGREVISRFDRAFVHGLAPLVGRSEELLLLHALWEKAVYGEGQAVLILGEAGVGKSRVVQAVRETLPVEQSYQVVCQCWPQFKDSAFYPVIEMLTRSLRLTRENTAAENLERLERALKAMGVEPAQALPLLASLLSLPLQGRYAPPLLSPKRLREELLKLLAKLVLRLSGSRPLLLVVEDLHWVDPSTLQLLTMLVDQALATRALLLFTARPEFHSPLPQRAWSRQLVLDRLSPGLTKELVKQVAHDVPLPPGLVEQLAERTDGIPLFVEEMTRMALELYARPGGGAPTYRAELQAIPETLQGLLTARLDRIPPEPRELARIAAVLGRSFTEAMLAAVSGWEQSVQRQALATLLASGLLQKQREAHDRQYQFRHVLIRDAAYQSLPRSRLRQYHRRVAQVLTTQFEEQVQLHPELLAHHHEAAGNHGEAIQFWAQAGQLAAQGSATQEAIGHFRAALRLIKYLPDEARQKQEELRLQIGLGNNLMATRGYGALEVEASYGRARALCGEVGDTPQLSPVLHGLWLYYFARAQFQTARQLGEQMLGLGHCLKSEEVLTLGHRMLGTTLFATGEFCPALEQFEQALQHYVPEQHRSLASVYGVDPAVASLSYVSWIHWYLGHPEQAHGPHSQAIALAQEVAHPHTSALMHCYASTYHQLRCEPLPALRRADIALALAREHQLALWIAWSTIMKGWALVAQGTLEPGLSLLREGIEGWRSTGAETGMANFLTLLAEACLQAHRARDGMAAITEALAFLRRNGERYYEAELYRVRGELLFALGAEPPEALGCFLQAIAVAQRQASRSLELRATVGLCRWLPRLGRREEARSRLGALLGGFTEGWDTLDLREARTLLEQLA